MVDLDRRWCIVHNSVRYEAGHCEWDVLIGNRPARGECEFVIAKISYDTRHKV